MSEFTDSDFEALEAAVMETPRGRWFLGEYARRARAADTKVLLGAIRKLERGMAGLNPPGGSADVVNELDAVSQALAAAIADAAALHHDPAPDGAHTKSAKAETPRLGRDLAELATALSGFAEALRPAEAESLDPSVLGQAAGELSRLSLMQDAVSQRTDALTQRLVHIKARLDAVLGAEPARAGSDLTSENLSYFGGDEDLFESGSDAGARDTTPAPSLSLVDSGAQPARPEPPASPAAERVAMAAQAGPDKERVVFIRRASSDQTSIPLAEESAEEQPDSRPARGV